MSEFNNAKIETDHKKQMFICGISCEGKHLIEKENRNGYTVDFNKAGLFNNVQTNDIVKHFESNGYQRWAIPKEIFDSYRNQQKTIQELESLLKEAVKEIEVSCDYDATWIVDERNILIDKHSPEYERFISFEMFLKKPEIKKYRSGE